jgi:hypothetical protein
MRQRRFGEGDRHELVRVESGDTGPADMIGDPHRVELVDEALQPREVVAVQRIG